MTASTLQQTDSSKSFQQWIQQAAGFFLRPIAITKQYKWAFLQPDLIAGLTVAVVMLPQAIAYALIAELPPQTGIYAAFVAAIIGALWGSSSHLHTGPTNAASLLVLSTLIPIATVGSPEYLAAAGVLAVLVGLIRLVMGLARLGLLVNFVADSVVIGFTAGAGILISVNQLRHLFGLDIQSSALFLTTLSDIITNLSETHLPSLSVGFLTIALMIGIKQYLPKWPNALLGMIIASAVVAIFGLDKQGVIVLGALPSGFPPLTSLPIFDLSLIRELSTGALAISVIGLVEATSIARSIASQSGEHVDNNQEFVGQGISNIVAGFFSGYTCSGSFTRSAINYTAGGRTPISSIFSSLFVMLAVLLFAPLAAYIPRAALAGLLVVTAYGMVDRSEMKRIWHTSRGDTTIMFATIIATLILPIEFAVLTGVLVSFGRFIVTTSMPEVHSTLPDEDFNHFLYQPEKQDCPQLGVITIEGELYFGAAHHIEEAIRTNMDEHPEQQYLLLRMHQINFCDISGIHMLEAVIRLYRQKEGDVFLVGVRNPVREKMRDSGFEALIGDDHFLSQERAIEHIFYEILDPSLCIYRCKIRAWKECQQLPKSDRLPNAPLGTRVPPAAILQSLAPIDLWRQFGNNGHAPTVIDVRESVEFEREHIPRAKLIPMPELLTNVAGLAKDDNIVFICRTGRRSTQVIYALQQQGFTSIANVQGGMVAWKEAGLPVIE